MVRKHGEREKEEAPETYSTGAEQISLSDLIASVSCKLGLNEAKTGIDLVSLVALIYLCGKWEDA